MAGRVLAAMTFGLALVLIAPALALAEPPPTPTYVETVEAALSLIQGAAPADTVPATRALRVLIDRTGLTQPEIIDDLRSRPPLYDDARRRLEALLQDLQHPLGTADPGLAQQRLHDVLSQSRYDALHRPPSAWDRFLQWIDDRITSLMRLLFGPRSGGTAPEWLFYLAGLIVVGAVVFVLVRAGRGRLGQSISAAPDGPRPASDFFCEADRMSAGGDRIGAIRALCAAVAATLAGERSWEGSALTVREIFSRSSDFKSLQALLLPFEAAVYGGRDVDQATYQKAAAVAARFRTPAKVEAAA